MSSGMNKAQAEEYAKTMTYKQAISNIRTGKGVIYRKATMIKLHELAEIADKLVLCKDCRHWYKKMNKCNRCPSISGNWGADDFCSYGERSE